MLRSTRQYLAEEPGLDPGPALGKLKADILAQNLTFEPTTPTAPAIVVPRPEPVTPPEVNGRPDELAGLRAAARLATTDRRQLVWLGGEPGAGKSTLCGILARELGEAGWHVGVGGAPEVDGVPPGWAWNEALDTLAGQMSLPAHVREHLAPLLADPTTTVIQPFVLSRWLADYLTTVARDAPTLLVLDDMHRADDLTLQLLRQVVESLNSAPILVLATYRPEEVSRELAAVWAATATVAPQHLELSGLSRAGITALAARQGLQPMPSETLDLIADRTGGNPLFVQELSRLVVSEGVTAAESAVPARIADVLRRRIARLPGRTQTSLRRAAVLGRDVDLEILVGMGDSDDRAARRGVDLEEQLLDDLEPAVTAGLLTEPAPGRVRFAHTLVRDTLYADLPRMRRTRMHHVAATVLAVLRPQDRAAVAHHAVHAATPATAESAAEHAVDAARAAESLTAHRDAVHWWSVAVDTYELCPNRLDTRTIDMLVPLVAALARTGNVVRARATRQHAVDLARRLDDRRRLVAALTSWDAPVIWTLRVADCIDYAITTPVRDALADSRNDSETCARLLTALVYEFEGLDCDAASESALRARTLARAAGDPRALCGALGALGYIAYGPDLSPQRLPNAEELLCTATAHRFDDYRALAHFQLFLAKNAQLDLVGAVRHLGESLALASGGQVGQLVLVGMAYDALCDVLAGRLDAAQAAYERVTERIVREGTAGGGAFGLVGAMSCAAARGNFGELVGPLSVVADHWPVAVRIPLSLALFDAGDHAAARATWTKSAPYPRDYFWLPMTTLRAHVAARLRDAEACATIRSELEPFSVTIAGLESGSMYAGPVDSALAVTADVVGDPQAAAGYRAAADDLMRRVAAQVR